MSEAERQQRIYKTMYEALAFIATQEPTLLADDDEWQKMCARAAWATGMQNVARATLKHVDALAQEETS